MNDKVLIRRSWLEDVVKSLQGPLPTGHIGDTVFLLRDQLRDILDRKTPEPDDIPVHVYSPDAQAMGDCRVCGHDGRQPWHRYTKYEIEHDAFVGVVIGNYRTHEGKRGAVLQQVGTRVVHVYGEKFLK